MKRQLLVLRRFLHHCKVSGLVARNPLEGCRVSLSPLQPLSIGSVRELVSSVIARGSLDGDGIHQTVRRDVLLLLLLIILGLRIAWLPGLLLADIRRSGSGAVLRAPDGTDTQIPPLVLAVIAAYLSRRKVTHDRLLLNDSDDGPFSYNALRLTLHRIVSAPGVSFDAHILHNTYLYLLQDRAAHAELMDYLSNLLSGQQWEGTQS